MLHSALFLFCWDFLQASVLALAASNAAEAVLLLIREFTTNLKQICQGVGACPAPAEDSQLPFHEAPGAPMFDLISSFCLIACARLWL